MSNPRLGMHLNAIPTAAQRTPTCYVWPESPCMPSCASEASETSVFASWQRTAHLCTLSFFYLTICQSANFIFALADCGVVWAPSFTSVCPCPCHAIMSTAALRGAAARAARGSVVVGRGVGWSISHVSALLHLARSSDDVIDVACTRIHSLPLQGLVVGRLLCAWVHAGWFVTRWA